MIFKLQEFKQIFLEDYKNNLEKISTKILEIEKNGNSDLFNELLRLAHNIKGASASVGFEKTAFLMHKVEEIFQQLREKKITISSELINFLLQICDFLAKNLKEIEQKEQDLENETIVNIIDSIISKKTESLKINQNKNLEKREPKSIQKNLKPEIDSLKIPTQKADFLIENMNELYLQVMNLDELIKKIEKKNMFSDEIILLKKINHSINRELKNLKYFMNDLSLIELESIFVNLPRIVHDTAIIVKKEIDFKIRGAEIKIDRTIFSRLYDSLVHILRNAIVHGISKKGTISLEAVQQRDFIEISITDNGKGIDFQFLLEKALKENLLSEKEKKELGKLLPVQNNGSIPEKLKKFIFQKRVSSTEQPDELSGRGVGMDEVKKFIEITGGEVDIILLNPGTKFILKLPYHVSLIKILTVKIDNFIYGIPVEYIKVIKNSSENNGDQIISLPSMFSNNNQTKNASQILAVSSIGKEKSAFLAVEKILEEQEVLLHPIPNFLFKKNFFIGTALLNNGKTCLILDIPFFLGKISPEL